MTRFVEVQRFSPALMGAIVGFIVVVEGLVAFGFPEDVPAGQRGYALSILITVPALLVVIFACFRLRTRVEGGQVQVGFPLWLARTIPVSNIHSVEVVSYRPLRDFGGWGLRFGREGVMYNAQGDRAVRLVLKDGKAVFIGSQRPEELAAAIDFARRFPGSQKAARVPC